MKKNQYIDFLNFIFTKLEEIGIDVSNFELDHLAYQASSDQDYDLRKEDFLQFAKLVSEEMVGGRRVGIYEMFEPVIYHDRSISVIELIAPKINQVCPSALEHVEFIVQDSFADFMVKYPNLNWDTSAVDQVDFPMLKLKLNDTVQVKFHYTHILEILKKKYEA